MSDRERLREALDLADYRLGQLLGNTDADDAALRAVREARAALAHDRPSGSVGLREALEREHEKVCSCPFDGTDPDCNLTISGTWIGAAALSDSSDPEAGETREMTLQWLLADLEGHHGYVYDMTRDFIWRRTAEYARLTEAKPETPA